MAFVEPAEAGVRPRRSLAMEVRFLGSKHVGLRHEGGLRFVAATGSGHEIVMDNATGDTGARPTELVLAAIAGCTAMDVVEILAKKRQAVTGYRTEVSGEQRELSPNVFLEIDVLHIVEGDVDTEAVRRSVELSATKYCTVSAQIATGSCRIHHRYRIVRPADSERPSEETAEVVVTGPMLELVTA
jgi:putative redox protein